MRIYIKYMVSVRCKMIVETELEKIGMKNYSVGIGYIDLGGPMTWEQRQQLNGALQKCGLELVEDKKSSLIEKIKKIIIDLVHHADEPLKINFSTYLSEKLNYDYTYMGNVFSEITAVCIENYMIALKIERVKQLLVYDELTLTEISYKLHYSSVPHLSNQFKKYTGLTPSSFKNIQQQKKLNARPNVSNVAYNA